MKNTEQKQSPQNYNTIGEALDGDKKTDLILDEYDESNNMTEEEQKSDISQSDEDDESAAPSEEEEKERAKKIKNYREQTLRRLSKEREEANFDEDPSPRPSFFSRLFRSMSCTSTNNAMNPNEPNELDIQNHEDSRTSPNDEQRPVRKVRFEGDILDQTEVHKGTTPGYGTASKLKPTSQQLKK